jgi:hypothetical protein
MRFKFFFLDQLELRGDDNDLGSSTICLNQLNFDFLGTPCYQCVPVP